MLINFNEDTVLKFFYGIGPAEASCMCFAIAVASGAPTMAPLDPSASLPIPTTQAQCDRALNCLSDPKYISTATWPSAPEMPDYAAAYRGPGRGDAGNYGTVLSVSEPEWSHMHAGLVLFVYRLLHKVWDTPLLRVIGSGGGSGAKGAVVGGLTAVELALPAETLAALQGAAAALGVVVARVLQLLQGRGVGERKMWSPMDEEAALHKRSRRQSAAALELERVAAIGCGSCVCTVTAAEQNAAAHCCGSVNLVTYACRVCISNAVAAGVVRRCAHDSVGVRSGIHSAGLANKHQLMHHILSEV